MAQSLKRFVGTSPLKVHPLGLGSATFIWTVPEKECFRMLDAYVDAGGNFIDTADMYFNWAPGGRGGEAERVIGKWMRLRRNRPRLVLATKVRARMWEGWDGEGLSAPHIDRALEESLRRLGTDWIDLYQAHWPDEATPLSETLAAFDKAVASGKVRQIGCSNFSPELLEKSMDLARRMKTTPFISTQPHFNLAARGFEKGQLALVKRHRLAVFPYGPQAEGFLTGRYRKGAHPGTSERLSRVKRYFNKKGWQTLEALLQGAREASCSPAQLALAWLLSLPWITAPILGASSTPQLLESLKAARLKIDPRIFRNLEKASHG